MQERAIYDDHLKKMEQIDKEIETTNANISKKKKDCINIKDAYQRICDNNTSSVEIPGILTDLNLKLGYISTRDDIKIALLKQIDNTEEAIKKLEEILAKQQQTKAIIRKNFTAFREKTLAESKILLQAVNDKIATQTAIFQKSQTNLTELIMNATNTARSCKSNMDLLNHFITTLSNTPRLFTGSNDAKILFLHITEMKSQLTHEQNTYLNALQNHEKSSSIYNKNLKEFTAGLTPYINLRNNLTQLIGHMSALTKEEYHELQEFLLNDNEPQDLPFFFAPQNARTDAGGNFRINMFEEQQRQSATANGEASDLRPGFYTSK